MDTAEVIRIDVSGPYADGTAYESADYRPAQKESLGLTMWTASPISQAANVVSVAIQAGFTIDQLAGADLFFQPNFSQPINFVGAVAIQAVAES